MEEENKNYIPPDYSVPPEETEHPREDDDDLDDDISVDDDDDDDLDEGEDLEDADLEKEEQKIITEKKKEMNEGSFGSPFGNTSPWANQFQTTPWSQNTQTQQSNTPTWGSQSWGSKPVEQPKPEAMLGPTTPPVRISRPRKYVFCDLIDGIIESTESKGKPNVQPRGTWDIRMKYEVWDKLASFNPEYIFVMEPESGIQGDNRMTRESMFDYIIRSLSEYIRIPKKNCQIVNQAIQGQPKEDSIEFILDGLGDGDPKKDSVYIGVYSGWWGLSNGDKISAEKAGIDYADIYQLIRGEV